MARWILVCLMVLHWSAAAFAAAPQPEEAPSADAPREDGSGRPDGLPLPRFVSLRADSVNLRVGPNIRYPIEWIYVRRNLPVEIIAEFDTWRRIKDPAGTEGWVHSSMLSGRRTGIVTGGVHALRRDMNETSDLVASLEQGVIVQIDRCPEKTGYCRVKAEGVQGWLKRDQIWGVFPDEVID